MSILDRLTGEMTVIARHTPYWECGPYGEPQWDIPDEMQDEIDRLRFVGEIVTAQRRGSDGAFLLLAAKVPPKWRRLFNAGASMRRRDP